MKIRLTPYTSTQPKSSRTVAVSIEKIKPRKPNQKANPTKNLMMTGIKNPIVIAHPKTVSIKQQAT
jgi:hypothetical protein